MSLKIKNLIINVIRSLSVDMIKKANSGHPGAPLGQAPIIFALYSKFLCNCPKYSNWINRDRFILSSGHASAGLYSVLHLFGYKISIEDLKKFRQFNSVTPGHPVFGTTHGVEMSTGPLGAGIATAVGLAMAEAHLSAKYNKKNFKIFNNYTFVLCGDGDLMEGISCEASSIAGTFKLGKLVILYDSNNITIEGKTNLTFNENVIRRYKSYGFETFLVKNGNDINELEKVIKKAKSNLNKPSFIEIKTKIGFASPRENSSSVHGIPLNEKEIKILKKNLDLPINKTFYVPKKIYNYCKKQNIKNEKKYKNWLIKFKKFSKKFPILRKNIDINYKLIKINHFIKDKKFWKFKKNKKISTRAISEIIINRLIKKYNNFFGGSADLAPSNMTRMLKEKSFSCKHYNGKMIHFGVREISMAAIGNGIILYGGLKSYVATFLVFSDYLKPMARLSALMKLPLIYIFTHDSLGVGEDGSSHIPVEHLTMLRSIPNFITYRPANPFETACGWALSMTSKKTPYALILSKQDLPILNLSNFKALRGGYIIEDEKNFNIIIIASGSEVYLALESKKILKKKYNAKIRVISMPSLELFNVQSKKYKKKILPKNISSRVIIECASSLSWGKIIGLNGLYITLDNFSKSAPSYELFKYFGFEINNIVKKIKNKFLNN